MTPMKINCAQCGAPAVSYPTTFTTSVEAASEEEAWQKAATKVGEYFGGDAWRRAGSQAEGTEAPYTVTVTAAVDEGARTRKAYREIYGESENPDTPGVPF